MVEGKGAVGFLFWKSLLKSCSQRRWHSLEAAPGRRMMGSFWSWSLTAHRGFQWLKGCWCETYTNEVYENWGFWAPFCVTEFTRIISRTVEPMFQLRHQYWATNKELGVTANLNKGCLMPLYSHFKSANDFFPPLRSCPLWCIDHYPPDNSGQSISERHSLWKLRFAINNSGNWASSLMKRDKSFSCSWHQPTKWLTFPWLCGTHHILSPLLDPDN